MFPVIFDWRKEFSFSEGVRKIIPPLRYAVVFWYHEVNRFMKGMQNFISLFLLKRVLRLERDLKESYFYMWPL